MFTESFFRGQDEATSLSVAIVALMTSHSLTNSHIGMGDVVMA